MGDRRHARIEGYLSRLFAYALSLTNDRDSARDLLQEALVHALAARRVPDDEPRYRAWLFCILRNAFLDNARRSGREIAIRADDLEVDRGAVWNYDERLISHLTVKAGMARLVPHHREIITLVDIIGFSYGEAATLLDVPKGTVMSRLSRGRQALLSEIMGGKVHPLPLAAGRKAR